MAMHQDQRRKSNRIDDGDLEALVNLSVGKLRSRGVEITPENILDHVAYMVRGTVETGEFLPPTRQHWKAVLNLRSLSAVAERENSREVEPASPSPGMH